MLFFRLNRDGTQIVFGFLIAILMELMWSRSSNKFESVVIKDRILSAITPLAGALLYLRSSYWWFYGLAMVVGISSKYLFRHEKSESIFNPLAFIIVFVLAFFPTESLYIKPDPFDSDLYPILQSLLIGLFLVKAVNRWVLSASYIITVIIISICLSLMQSLSFWEVWLPETSLLLIVFTFFMITDPKTSPRTYKGQLIFGFFIAIAHMMLREYEVPYSEFVALFLATGIRPIFKSLV